VISGNLTEGIYSAVFDMNISDRCLRQWGRKHLKVNRTTAPTIESLTTRETLKKVDGLSSCIGRSTGPFRPPPDYPRPNRDASDAGPKQTTVAGICNDIHPFVYSHSEK